MHYLDLKYANLLSNNLERFKIKSNMPYRANFRCPLCGDSQKSKSKARGWILEHNNHAYFCCHNGCGNKSFGEFLERVNPILHQEWQVEKVLDKNGLRAEPEKAALPDSAFKTEAPKFKALAAGSPLLRIKKISSLPHDHPAKQYVVNRLIPPETHFRLYYAPKFKKFVNSILPGKMEHEEKDEPRLILPFIDKKGNLFGFQGRSFVPDAFLRYITIMFDENHAKIFGMDQCNTEETYYVFEGPIDSLFIKNSIAMAGSALDPRLLPNPENAVFVFDNEPRKPEIVAKIEKCIDLGLKVALWGPKIKQKDVNDMVLKGGMSAKHVKWEIDRRTFSGLAAKLELSEWRGVKAA
ncbi:DNA primase [Sinorhizobium phage phiN3]|uniref:DNA primase n=1 Tax=Sinorhizobium phage phiN3 TaxID=1647405 RepID=A0A0F6YPC0_9CAUD|nr:DNA primase [Sinorhizobium phage phiN3]AKF13619.1 DNA primase [Sinorhizobium phage phiN3]